MPLNGTVGYVYEYQPVAVLNQAAPVQDTWYTVLDAANCRVYGLGVAVEDVNETVELRVTVDGVVMVASVAATHSTVYFPFVFCNPLLVFVSTLGLSTTSTFAQYKAFQFEGRSVKIELRKTTAAGAGNLCGVTSYGVLKPI